MVSLVDDISEEAILERETDEAGNLFIRTYLGEGDYQHFVFDPDGRRLKPGEVSPSSRHRIGGGKFMGKDHQVVIRGTPNK